MGNCCVSSTVKATPHSQSGANSKQRITTPPLSHPVLEEETVKEVLSETPNFPKPTLPIDNEPQKHQLLTAEQGKKRNDGDLKKPAAAVVDFTSEEFSFSEDFSASEICSTLSENAPAIAMTGKIDREDDARQRSPARDRSRPFPGEARRARSVGNSPSRRSDPSPGRVRSGTGGRNSARRSPANGSRKENYENAGRRSMSPVTRVENAGARTGYGRSPSVRKTGKSPGRARSDMGEKNRKLEESNGNLQDSKEKWASTNSNELLENPLVSLECFIFL